MKKKSIKNQILIMVTQTNIHASKRNKSRVYNVYLDAFLSGLFILNYNCIHEFTHSNGNSKVILLLCWPAKIGHTTMDTIKQAFKRLNCLRQPGIPLILIPISL